MQLNNGSSDSNKLQNGIGFLKYLETMGLIFDLGTLL